MTINDKVTIFTAAMRSEFMTAYEGLRPTGMTPWTNWVTRIPSNARLEQYPWMSPPPRLKQWIGRRNYSTPDYTKYIVPNIEYDAAESVWLRDIEDDQTGGYGTRMRTMAQDVVNFPGRQALKLLTTGSSTACFDASNFFATTHNIGTGSNALTATGSTNDGATHKIVSLIISGQLKPVIWQDRKDKGLRDNGNTPQSEEEKKVKFWYDYEGAAGFGFWWDAIQTTITNTPTVNDLEPVINAIEVGFRTFQLDKADPADDPWWVHEQLTFDTTTILHICNPSLENVLKTLLTVENIQAGTAGGTKTNIYRGHGALAVSAFFGN
jgi:phage major head subunit gpT-like protein